MIWGSPRRPSIDPHHNISSKARSSPGRAAGRVQADRRTKKKKKHKAPVAKNRSGPPGQRVSRKFCCNHTTCAPESIYGRAQGGIQHPKSHLDNEAKIRLKVWTDRGSRLQEIGNVQNSAAKRQNKEPEGAARDSDKLKPRVHKVSPADRTPAG